MTDYSDRHFYEMPNCTIPIAIDHLSVEVRREAALWCLDYYGADNVNVWRLKKLDNGNMVACFWFKNNKDANWFVLRWL
jgi:hypothetical protein